MKINIKKYQNGGGVNPPFVYYKPVDYKAQEQQETSSEQPKAKETSSGSLDDKQLFDMVQGVNGLPSDMAGVIQKLNLFYTKANLFNTTGKIDAGSLSTQYLQTLLQVKTANFNKEEFTDAKKQATENQALNDIAIGKGGTLTVLDSNNKLKFVTVKDFLNSKGDLRAVTNSDLLQIRSLDIDYVNNNDIFKVIKNGIGMEKVTKMIQDVLSNINSTEFKREGYATSNGKEIIKGAQALQNINGDPSGMSLSGTYKYSKSFKNNTPEIQAAIKYIAAMLPENAKTLLALHSGNKENPYEGALSLIGQLASVRSQTSDNQDISLIANYDGEGNPANKNKSQKDAYDLMKTNQVMAIQNNYGGNKSIYSFQPKDSNTSLSIAGTSYGAIKDINNKIITDTNYQDLLAKSGLGAVSDTRSIVFGDKVLPHQALNEILYTNTGLIRALLPSKLDSYGNKIPDFTYFKKYEQANKEIRKLPGNLTDKQFEQKSGQILAKHGLSNLTINGVPDTRKFGIFLVADALTTSRVIKDPSGGMEDVSADDSLYDYLQKNLYTTPQGKSTYTLDRNNFYDFNGYDHIYRAPIYIPISSNSATSYMSNGATWNQLQGLQEKYDTEDIRTHSNPTGSDNLNK